MNNYIKTVVANLFNNDIFDHTINFSPELNIISGANGSCKTKLLQLIRAQKDTVNVVKSVSSSTINIVTFSPKRVAAKTIVNTADQQIRQQPNYKNYSEATYLSEGIIEEGTQTIKSISEYFVADVNEAIDNNKPKNDAATETEQKYSSIAKKIFGYDIKFNWDSNQKIYDLKIIKHLGIEINIEHLSSGENAVLSLVFAIYFMKNKTDLFIIDEPEVHLNWQLETKLFEFFNCFCCEYKKQMIIVTHSRVCFTDPYIKMTKFFDWADGKVVVLDKPTKEITGAIAGDMVKIINGITTHSKLVYCEDKSHEFVLSKLSELLSLDLEIIKLSGCEPVKQCSAIFKPLEIGNTYFLIDNDNKPIKQDDVDKKYLNLIQLKKYCIENYFLDVNIIKNIIDEENTNITRLLQHSIKEVNDPYFVVYKKLIDKDVELAEFIDFIDASKFFDSFAKKVGFNDKKQLICKYMTHLNNQNKLKDFFKDLDILFR